MLKISKVIILGFIFFLTFQFANASLLTEKVSEYREKGFEAQRKGELEKAKEYYQKVIQIDPCHIVTYNDLGVLYETQGQLKLAEDSYLKAIQIDSNFLSPYYNLGCLYENLNNYDKAIEYFQKRVDLGDPSEIWTQRAKDKIVDIQNIINPPVEEEPEPVVEQPPVEIVSKEEVKESEVVIKDIDMEDLIKKEEKPKEEKPLYTQRETRDPHIERAEKAFQDKDYFTAEIEASRALQLDPYSKEAEELLRKSHRKFLVE